MVVYDAGIACKQDSRWSILEHSTANVLIEPLPVIQGNWSEFIVRRNERLITNASIQRQAGSSLPSILNVKSDVILTIILGRKLSPMPGRGFAQHQIRQRQARTGSVERHLPGSKCPGSIIHQRMDIVCSETNLMRALGQA